MDMNQLATRASRSTFRLHARPLAQLGCAALLCGAGVGSARAQATPAPSPVAEATLPVGVTTITWPILPISVEGHALHVVLDVGTTTSWLNVGSLQRLGITLPVDSVVIGTSVQRDVFLGQGNGPGGPGLDGLVGTPLLSHYDLVFDGPHHEVRLYAQSASPIVGKPGWLPEGVSPADCMPMQADPQDANRIFFPLAVNGHAIHSMFDSGSNTTNINVAAAKVLGLSSSDPDVHLLPPGIGGQFSRFKGQRIWRDATTRITVGRQHIVTPVNIYQDLPRESSPTDPELSLGLNAVSDRVLYASYSTRTVCIGRSHPGATVALQGATAPVDPMAEAPLSPEVLSHYIAAKRALVQYWTAHPSRYRRAQATAHAHAIPLDEYTVGTGAFDYPALVERDTALARIFTTSRLAPAQFEPTQVAAYAALATLVYDRAMGIALPAESTALGRNVALVEAHHQALASVGLGWPSQPAPAPSW